MREKINKITVSTRITIPLRDMLEQEAEEQGFSFEELITVQHYVIRDDHEVVYDTDGNFAGIVKNVAVMQKYMESLK